MSEQKQSYMAALDAWTDQVIISALAEDGFVAGLELSQRIRKAIREKALESYRNGIRAGAGSVRRETQQTEGKHAVVASRR